MAGGKESPRQKMIGMMYLVLTAMLAMNVSKEIVNAFITVDKSLQKSGELTMSKSKNDIDGIESARKDPKIAEKAAWASQASQKVASERDALLAKIKEYKKGLLTFANETEALADSNLDPDKIQQKDNFDFPPNYFIMQGNAAKLKADLQALGPKLKSVLQDKAGISDAPDVADAEINKIMAIAGFSFEDVKSQDGTKKTWEDATFHTPMVATLALLTSYENSVKNAAADAIALCATKIGSKTEVKMDNFMAMVNQNSAYFAPDEQLVAEIALGAYSSSNNPTVTVGGQSIPVVGGKATYKQAAGNGGEKNVVVSFNGKSYESKLKWDVAGAASAVVSAEATKVFYIGVDNPVKIAASGKIKGQSVSISGGGGTISMSGDKDGTVRVSAPGEATITVSSEGKTLTQDKFRVKKIPNPTPMVLGKSGGAIAKGAMGAGFVEAKTDPNFLFNVNFVVTSFKVGAQGKGGIYQEKIVSGYSLAPAASILPSAGGKVFIENIKVKGPDGERVLPGSLVFTMQ